MGMLKPLPKIVQFESKPKRLPRAMRMTICIGMTASDGLVLAADAQESDQYYKRSQQKIFPFVGNITLGQQNPPPPQMGCAFTGSGESGYLDAFFEYVINGIRVDSSQIDFKEFLAEKVRTFHEKHLFPLAIAANPPEIDVLIGAYIQLQTCMFVSHGSTLRRAGPYAAVGAGAHFALSMISELWRNQDVAHTEILAAYIIGITKERIEACGNYTAIVSVHGASIVNDLPDGRSRLVPPPHPLSFVPSGKIRKWEESFATRLAPRQVKLVEEFIEEELASDSAPSPED
jgi:hypothetical protein